MKLSTSPFARRTPGAGLGVGRSAGTGAVRIAARPRSDGRTFGLQRLEILAAAANAAVRALVALAAGFIPAHRASQHGLVLSSRGNEQALGEGHRPAVCQDRALRQRAPEVPERVAEVIEQPSAHREALAKVIEVLGEPIVQVTGDPDPFGLLCRKDAPGALRDLWAARTIAGSSSTTRTRTRPDRGRVP